MLVGSDHDKMGMSMASGNLELTFNIWGVK